MDEVNVGEARRRIAELLDRVASGEEILITRRGKAVAKWSRPAAPARKRLPSLARFREGIKREGTPSSELIRDERDQD